MELNVKKIEDIKLGDFVKRVRKDGTPMTRVYERSGSCGRGTFALVDVEDCNRFVYVKKGTLLHIGFTY